DLRPGGRRGQDDTAHRRTRRRRRTVKLPTPPLSPSKDLSAHPLLRGQVSRWAWGVYAQRLTPAGRWLILPTLALSTYGGASLQLQGYVVFSYVAALWWVAIVAM